MKRQGEDSVPINLSGLPASIVRGTEGDDVYVVPDGPANGRTTIYFGGGGNDVYVSLTGNNVVYAGDGNNVASIIGSNNVVAGGSGVDAFAVIGDDSLLTGGAGVDTLVMVGNDGTLYGGSGDDIIAAIGDRLVVGGDRGRDVITVSGNDGRVSGGDDDDTIDAFGSGHTVDGGAGADLIAVDGIGNTMFGGTGNDSIFGGAGADRIDGGADADRILGNGSGGTVDFRGAPALIGAGLRPPVPRGADVLTGGAGSDVFVFDADDDGAQVVTDFRRGQDRLEIAGIDAAAGETLVQEVITGGAYGPGLLVHESGSPDDALFLQGVRSPLVAGQDYALTGSEPV